MTDALGRVTNYQYDDFNRLVKTTYPPVTTGATRLFETLEYDATGNVTKRTDTAGRATAYLYDSASRIARVTDPALQVTNFEYNPRSQMTALVDALNQRYEFAYDSLGRVTQTTRAGLSMSYAYDALNRLTTITYPSNQTTSYGYDALSRLTAATNANGTVALGYDNRSRVTNHRCVQSKCWLERGKMGQACDLRFSGIAPPISAIVILAVISQYLVHDAANRICLPLKLTDERD